jgi:hypothetical protein
MALKFVIEAGALSSSRPCSLILVEQRRSLGGRYVRVLRDPLLVHLLRCFLYLENKNNIRLAM